MSILKVIHLIDVNSDWLKRTDPKEVLKLEEIRKKISEYLKKDKNK